MYVCIYIYIYIHANLRFAETLARNVRRRKQESGPSIRSFGCWSDRVFRVRGALAPDPRPSNPTESPSFQMNGCFDRSIRLGSRYSSGTPARCQDPSDIRAALARIAPADVNTEVGTARGRRDGNAGGSCQRHRISF